MKKHLEIQVFTREVVRTVHLTIYTAAVHLSESFITL